MLLENKTHAYNITILSSYIIHYKLNNDLINNTEM
jgi:hypothetical protein